MHWMCWSFSIPINVPTPRVNVDISGLLHDDYYFLYSTGIAYPCWWDNSGRTVVRNLMNQRLSLVCGKRDACADAYQHYKTANIQDLRKLKMRSLLTTPHVKQNCDATSRVLTQWVCDDLKPFVPGSEGTQLYLVAATATHEPFRNSQFGPPSCCSQKPKEVSNDLEALAKVHSAYRWPVTHRPLHQP